MMRQIGLTSAWMAGSQLLLGAAVLSAQTPLPIATIDFYGLRSVSEDAVRSALSLHEGDLQPTEEEWEAIERRLVAIPGVVAADMGAPCCDRGRLNVYIGIAEDSSTLLPFRAAPGGAARLPPEIVAAGEEFIVALVAAVRAGNSGDDMSQGHSLMADSVTRAVQERFLTYARQDLDLLREVLRTSSDAEHRALAAQIMGYAADKRDVIDDLLFAGRDPDESVRNNATRAVAAIAQLAIREPERGIRIPAAPFIELTNSLSWTDRNKGSFVLLALTERRDPEVLRAVRSGALDAIVEMARWKGGHGQIAFVLLGRLAARPDAEIFAAWNGDARAKFVEEALAAVGR